MSDRAHPPRATNIHELRALQKARAKERDGAEDMRRSQSLSQTLASSARRVGACLHRAACDGGTGCA